MSAACTCPCVYGQPDVGGAAPRERGAAGEECEELFTMVLGNGVCGVPQHPAPISLAGSCALRVAVRVTVSVQAGLRGCTRVSEGSTGVCAVGGRQEGRPL